MGEEEPGDDLNSPKGNSMTLSAGLKREVMVPPFFYCRGSSLPAGRQECRRYTIWAENLASPLTGDEAGKVTYEDKSRYHWSNGIYRSGASPLPDPSPGG